MAYAHHEKLIVWQCSIKLVEFVYRLTRDFPADEKSGLAATLRRTVTGIPASIANADGLDDPEKIRQSFGAIRGTIREMQTYAVICRRMRFVGYFSYQSMRRQLSRVDRMLVAKCEPDAEVTVKDAPQASDPASSLMAGLMT